MRSLLGAVFLNLGVERLPTLVQMKDVLDDLLLEVSGKDDATDVS